MPNEALRKAFEAHIRSTWRVPADYLDWALSRSSDGGYQDNLADAQWQGYAAGFEALAMPVREMREVQEQAAADYWKRGPYTELGLKKRSAEATVDALTAQGGKG